jgi:hypothetical protein
MKTNFPYTYLQIRFYPILDNFVVFGFCFNTYFKKSLNKLKQSLTWSISYGADQGCCLFSV